MINRLIEQLKIQNPDLLEAEIEGLLHILSKNPTQTAREVVSPCGLPLETVKKFLTSSGVTEGSKTQDLKPFSWTVYSASSDKKDVIKHLEEVREKHNLKPIREYDQFFATASTSLAKAEILQQKGVLENKDLLLIGDDDLVSLTIAFSGYKYKSITVVDVDERILKVIQAVSTENNFKNIKTKVYDVKELPKALAGTYDVVMIDPPYTSAGIKLFLRRAVEFLGKFQNYSGKHIFMFYGNSFKNPSRFVKIQDIISSYELVIDEKINKFAFYDGAESIGSCSSLYILKTTPSTSLPDAYLGENIYTFEDNAEKDFPFVDHYVFRLNNVPEEILTSKTQMQKLLGNFCNTHKLKVVDTKVTQFGRNAFTITYVLSNSNLVAHTWPEYKALHLDLVTCTPIYMKETLSNTLNHLFKTPNILVTKVR